MRLKTKLSLGIGFLFIVILVFGILGIYIINRMKWDAGNALANDYEGAITWLTILFSVLILAAFTLVVSFPAIISDPIRALSEGITAIVNKDYSKRIHLKQRDEFGGLANAFNIMAEKLDEYENSNLAKIKFEKSRIETIINQMKDGIIGLDDKKNVLFINEAGQNLLGLKEQDLAGRNVVVIALKNDLMRTLLQDEEKKDLKIYADGKESYFNKEILNVMNGGEVVGQVIILRNITPFHELNEAKTNFIATVSHELKTPISSIKMSLQLLENQSTGIINLEQKQLIESIKEDSNRLLKITGELLNLSQVETGNIQLSIQQSNPYAILQYALEAVKVTADQKNLRLKILSDENLPLIKADPEKTAWVLINLLTNAIRYSPENNEVEIEVKKKDRYIVFSVKDVGKGIEARYRDKIFTRYFQVPGSSRSGTGLGLSISKEFIEAQGGSIGVDSEIGSGSRFYFELST